MARLAGARVSTCGTRGRGRMASPCLWVCLPDGTAGPGDGGSQSIQGGRGPQCSPGQAGPQGTGGLPQAPTGLAQSPAAQGLRGRLSRATEDSREVWLPLGDDCGRLTRPPRATERAAYHRRGLPHLLPSVPVSSAPPLPLAAAVLSVRRSRAPTRVSVPVPKPRAAELDAPSLASVLLCGSCSSRPAAGTCGR